MLIDIGHSLDLRPKAPVEAERIQNPHFAIILLPSDWKVSFKTQPMRVRTRELEIFCCFL